MRALLVGLLAISVADTAAAGNRPPGVTVPEAQTLPIKELARRLLGDVGAALVADVDRPAWGEAPSRFGAPMVKAWPPEGPPPMSELVFYTQPMADEAFGLCEETVITISMSAASPSVPTEFSTEKRWGLVGSPNPPPGFWTERYGAELEKTCSAQHASRAYFPAPDRNVANAAARITEALSIAGKSNSPPSFAFSCSDHRSRCRWNYRALHDLNVTRITQVSEAPCSALVQKLARFPECYRIEYSTGLEGGGRVQELRSQTISVAVDLEKANTRIIQVRYDESIAVT